MTCAACTLIFATLGVVRAWICELGFLAATSWAARGFLAATFWAASGGHSVDVGVCFPFCKRFNLPCATPLFDLNWVNALFREHCRGSSFCELRARGCFERCARDCCSGRFGFCKRPPPLLISQLPSSKDTRWISKSKRLRRLHCDRCASSPSGCAGSNRRKTIDSEIS